MSIKFILIVGALPKRIKLLLYANFVILECISLTKSLENYPCYSKATLSRSFHFAAHYFTVVLTTGTVKAHRMIQPVQGAVKRQTLSVKLNAYSVSVFARRAKDYP